MRYPAVAGSFYPKNIDDLKSEIENSFKSKFGPGYIPALDPKGPRAIKAAVNPHAGYFYSGPVAAHTFAAMAKDGFPETFVILGPNHHALGPLVATTDQDFLMPMGKVEVDIEILDRIGSAVPKSHDAHRLEHSIEVQLPFIQYSCPEAKIVPIVMIDQTYETAINLAEILSDACRGKDVVFLESSDFSHYVPQDVAEAQDRKVIDRILSMNVPEVIDTVQRYKITMCGYGPVMTAMLASGSQSAGLLAYGTSGDACEMKDVVGYASIIMT